MRRNQRFLADSCCCHWTKRRRCYNRLFHYYGSESSTSRNVFPSCPLPSSPAAFWPAPRLLLSDTIWTCETVLRRVDVVQRRPPTQRRVNGAFELIQATTYQWSTGFLPGQNAITPAT